jgi:hypothetical protein
VLALLCSELMLEGSKEWLNACTSEVQWFTRLNGLGATEV